MPKKVKALYKLLIFGTVNAFLRPNKKSQQILLSACQGCAARILHGFNGARQRPLCPKDRRLDFEMKRREFVLNAGGLFVAASFFTQAEQALGFVAGRPLTDDELIDRILQKDQEKQCQMNPLSGSEFERARFEVNPNGEPGSFSKSIGCSYPHKHLLFIPARYFENPSLIESPIVFRTGRAYDMSEVVRQKFNLHSHTITLDRADFEKINREAAGIKKLAYQRDIPGGGLGPGHVFQITRG